MVHICDMVRYLIEFSAINPVLSQFSPPKGQFQCAWYEIIDSSSPGVSIITDETRQLLCLEESASFSPLIGSWK